MLTLFTIGYVIPAFAQVGYLWTPQELTTKADVVAIVEVISVRETGRTQGHPTLRPRLPVVEMEAELRVLAWLKASAASDPALNMLRLVYFRLEGEPVPALVSAGSTLRLTPGRTEYLAFLARAADGRYEPLSGHTFPTTSLRRLCEAAGSDQQTCPRAATPVDNAGLDGSWVF